MMRPRGEPSVTAAGSLYGKPILIVGPGASPAIYDSQSFCYFWRERPQLRSLTSAS